MIEAGIFDVGGVLVTDEMAHVRQDIRVTLAVPEAVFARAWAELVPLLGTGRITEAEFWRRFIALTGARGALPAESLFLREYARRAVVQGEVLALAARLRRRGLRTAVLSNTVAAHVEYLARRGLFDGFGVRIFSNEVGLRKPDPCIYRRCLEALGLGDRPEAAFFVDDVEENVAAARAVGIHGIVFTSARQLAADVRRLGVAL